MKKLLISSTVVLLFTFLITQQLTHVSAQVASGCTGMSWAKLTIRGKVTDSNMQPLTGVSVKAFNIRTEECVTTKTDAHGNYALTVASGVLKIRALQFNNLRFAPILYKLRITSNQDNLDFVGAVE